MPPSPAPQVLRSLCLTCGGSGTLDRAMARVAGTRIITGVTSEECWFCRGEGWIQCARRGGEDPPDAA